MTTARIRDLAAFPAPADTDLFPVDDLSGTTAKKTTVAQARTAFLGTGGTNAILSWTGAAYAWTLAPSLTSVNVSTNYQVNAFQAIGYSGAAITFGASSNWTNTIVQVTAGGTVVVKVGAVAVATFDGSTATVNGLTIGSLTGLLLGAAGVVSATAGTQGDILYRSAAGWVPLAAGTSGWYLKTLGAGANPAWAAVAGGSTPTGTGLTHNTGGAQDAASSIGTANFVMVTNGAATDTVWAALVNANISASAAIVLSKIVNPTGTGLVKATAGAFDAATSLLLNADVNAAAAIALSKMAAGTEGQAATYTGGTALGANNPDGFPIFSGTFSLIHNNGVTTDTNLYTSPSTTDCDWCTVVVRLTTAQVGASSSSAVTMGTSSGGNDILLVQTIVPGTTIGTAYGKVMSQLGSSFDATMGFVFEIKKAAAKSLWIRQVVSGANVTAGGLTVALYGRIYP